MSYYGELTHFVQTVWCCAGWPVTAGCCRQLDHDAGKPRNQLFVAASPRLHKIY